MNGHKLYYILQGIAIYIPGISFSFACKDHRCECLILTYDKGLNREAYMTMATIFREELDKCGIEVNWARILRQVLCQLRDEPDSPTISLELRTMDFLERVHNRRRPCLSHNQEENYDTLHRHPVAP